MITIQQKRLNNCSEDMHENGKKKKSKRMHFFQDSGNPSCLFPYSIIFSIFGINQFPFNLSVLCLVAYLAWPLNICSSCWRPLELDIPEYLNSWKPSDIPIYTIIIVLISLHYQCINALLQTVLFLLCYNNNSSKKTD